VRLLDIPQVHYLRTPLVHFARTPLVHFDVIRFAAHYVRAHAHVLANAPQIESESRARMLSPMSPGGNDTIDAIRDDLTDRGMFVRACECSYKSMQECRGGIVG
jgi:hypothetical protein